MKDSNSKENRDRHNERKTRKPQFCRRLGLCEPEGVGVVKRGKKGVKGGIRWWLKFC